MEKFIGLLNGIVLLLKERGIEAVLCIVILICFLGTLIPEIPTQYFNSTNAILITCLYGVTMFSHSDIFKKENHHKENKTRMASNYSVKTELLKLKYEAQADRAYIMEFHNGKENPTLLPFIYVDMTFEETGNNPKFVNQECQNMNTSLFNFPGYVAEHYCFIGSVEELIEIDPKIGHRMEDNGVKYCANILLKSGGIMIGILGLSYESEPKISREEIQTKLSLYAQDISDYLDLSKYKEKKKK